MADSPVRTLVKIGDPTTAANEAAVDASGNLTVILAANTGVDIGDVDITSFAVSDMEAEDDSIAYAISTLRTISLLYGDNGATWERISTDGSGAMDVGLSAAGGLTALELIDDVVFVAGTDTYAETTSKGNLILGVRNDALDALAGTDNEFAPLQVDASGSLYVTGGGGGQEYTEDVAAPADPVGATLMMRRDDVIAGTKVDAEDDWIGIYGTDEGALWVQDFNSDAILSDTTAILLDTAAIDTATAAIAAAVVQDDVATHSGSSTGMIMFGAATPTDTNIDSNDFGALAMSIDRRLHTDTDIVANGIGLALGTDISNVFGAGTLITTTQADTLANSLDGLQSTSFGYAYNGATWDRMLGDATDGLLVNLGTNNDVSFTAATLNGPVAVHGTESDTAVDASLTITEADTAGSPSYCAGFDASSSVPIKVVLQSVDSGSTTDKVVLFAAAGQPIEWRAPHRDYFINDVAGGGGFDGWQIVITNKDSTDAADTYGTIYTETT